MWVGESIFYTLLNHPASCSTPLRHLRFWRRYWWHQANFEAHPEDYDDLDLKDVERWARCSLEGLSQRERDNIICEYLNGFTQDEWEEMSGQNTPFEHALYCFLRKLSFSGVNVRNKKG